MAITKILTANGWQVNLVPPAPPEISLDNITDASAIGKLLLAAETDTEARLIIDAAFSQITAADISDSTATGRALLLAEDVSAARTTLSAAASPITVNDISNASVIGRQILQAADAAAERSIINAAASPITVNSISDASVLGKQLLSAATDSAARTAINAALKQDIFVEDIYTWTGSQTIANGAYFNLTTLPFVLQPGGDAGSVRTSAVFTIPVRPDKTLVLCSVKTGGTVGGSSGTSREFKVQVRAADGTTIRASNSTVKVQGMDISDRDQNCVFKTTGSGDPIQTAGFQVGILNESGATLTITSLNLSINRIRNLE